MKSVEFRDCDYNTIRARVDGAGRMVLDIRFDIASLLEVKLERAEAKRLKAFLNDWIRESD